MNKAIKNLIPDFILNSYRGWRKRRKYGQLAAKSAKEVFTEIYHSNTWGDDESISGSGSNLKNTVEIRERLPEIVREYGIKSMLDIPCGDFHWMKLVDLSGVQYIGADIVEPIINGNNEQYKSGNRSFKVMDLLEDALPQVDLVFCRDCMIHLSNAQSLQALRNIKKSGSKYLLATSFTDRPGNVDIANGQTRQINLEAAPFSLKPIAVYNEKFMTAKNTVSDRSMLLFCVADLAV